MEYKGLSSGICRLSATHRKQGANWVFGWVPEMNRQAVLEAILCSLSNLSFIPFCLTSYAAYNVVYEFMFHSKIFELWIARN